MIIVGGYILLLLTPHHLRKTLGSNALHTDGANCTDGECADNGYNVSQLQGFGVELMTVLLLVLVVLAVTDERRKNSVRYEKLQQIHD